MKIWSAIFNIFAVIILSFLLFSYTYIDKTFRRDFDQVRLNYAVESATEAMFQSTLEAEDVGGDYSKLGKIEINSSDALNIFYSLMCISYDMSLSERNFDKIQNSIASCMLAGTDGFYVGQFAPYDTVLDDGLIGDSYKLRWSVKYPYILKLKSSPYTYAVGFMDGAWKRITSNSLSIKNSKVYVPNELGYPMGVTEENIQHAVNAQVQSALLKEIDRRNLNKKGQDFKFYLPDMTTISGVNAIQPPSVMVLLQGVEYASSEKIDALTVSGFKVIDRVNVVAFHDTSSGRNYYCYETQLLDEEKDACCGGTGTGTFHIENYYRDIKSAAEAKGLTVKQHYYPYYEIMTRKITK